MAVRVDRCSAAPTVDASSQHTVRLSTGKPNSGQDSADFAVAACGDRAFLDRSRTRRGLPLLVRTQALSRREG